MDTVLRDCIRRVQTNLRGRLIVPYQAQGVLWMLRRELDQRYPGGLLCDEMGLGKTVQTIATIIGNPVSSTLVVVPKAVLTQWVEAFERFMGVQPLVVTSTSRTTADELIAHRIVLTTYPTVAAFKSRKGDDKDPFRGAVFGRIVCDEVHIIKNNTSKIFSYITEIDARIRWGLTGTPITCKLRDLANLMVYIGAIPLTKEKLMQMRSSFVLRRTKEDVARVSERLRLPPLEIRLATTPFRSEDERRLYEEIKREGRIRMATAKGDDNTHMHLLEMILRLRQCVVNPQVLLNGMAKKENDIPELWRSSFSKLDLLMELVAAQPPSQKTLIFCHWVGEMDAVQRRLREAGLDSARLDGSMSVAQRNEAIAAFSNGSDVNFFVIQIDCGGIGLNLQMATRVYVNSLHWNPANELQAISRTHRTGQTNKVIVTRLVVEDTIDEYIIQKQDGKLKITSETFCDPRILSQLNDVAGETVKLTAKDMVHIFSA